MSEKNINPKKGGDLLVECLLAEKVKYLFGIPGGQLLTMYDAVYNWGKEKGIQTIMVRHEQAGAHAADAYARVTGELGVCFGTVGPGVTDLVPGVGAAWSDNVPILVLGAQLKRSMDGKSCLQGDVDQITMMKPITKAQFQIQKAEEIPIIIAKAAKLALSGKKGPVFIEIREDALIEEIPAEAEIEVLPPERTRSEGLIAGDPNAIEKAVELLKSAKKPIIVVGGGVVSDDATEQVNKLSEQYSIPVGTDFIGIGGVDNELKTFLGASLNSDTLMNAAMYSDLVLSVGCKWDYSMGFGLAPLWPKDQKLIQVDIDPGEMGKNRSMDVGIVGNPRMVLEQLLSKMEETLPKEKATQWEQWNAEQQEYKEKMLKRYVKKYNSDKEPILPQRLVKEVLEEMPSDSILIADGGDLSVFAVEQVGLYKKRLPRSVLASVGMGHLGMGIPYAIGAKLAHPEKLVGVLNGDGSFLFNVQELETAVRYELPILVVIGNNGCWGMIKSGQNVGFKKRYCDVDFPEGLSYAKIAEGFGCHAETVTKPDEIKPALKRAIESGKPAVIDVKMKWDIPKGTKVLMQLGLI